MTVRVVRLSVGRRIGGKIHMVINNNNSVDSTFSLCLLVASDGVFREDSSVS